MLLRKLCLATVIAGVCCGAVEAHPTGLVLAGGGARGAYEVGVWQTLCELGMTNCIRVISGTSVGALNAALFASVKDPVRCAEIWQRTLSNAFAVNTNGVRSAMQKTVDDYSKLLEEEAHGREAQGKDFVRAAAALALSVFVRSGKHIERSISIETNSVGVCDSSSLRASLASILRERPFSQDITVYATAVEKARNKGRTFCLNGLDRGAVIDRLMASAALPLVFESVEVDGVQYLDGGYEVHGGDNVPIIPILNNHPEVRTIIVVYLRPINEVKRRVSRKGASTARVVEIFPSVNLGSVLPSAGHDGRRNEELIRLGRSDALAVLKCLDGNDYYEEFCAGGRWQNAGSSGEDESSRDDS